MNHLADIQRWLEKQQPELISTLVNWSNINTGSCNLEGLARMRTPLMAKFGALADEQQCIELPALNQLQDDGRVKAVAQAPLLSFRKRAEAPTQILFCGHMDTVFPASSPFQSANHATPGVLHGPGVADMKGGLLVLWSALAAWERWFADDNIGWHIVINADEETGSLASSSFLASSAKDADIGLVFEPALEDGTLAGARKGSGNFTVVVEGVAAHAGRNFDQGKNAIVALSELIADLNALNFERDDFTLNIARVRGGGALNQVADRSLCRFNVRVSESSTMVWAAERIRKLVEKINERDGFSAILQGSFHRAPKHIDPATEQLYAWLDECGLEHGINTARRPTGGCCDGNNLAAAGLPNIDTLGVRGGAIHTDREFMVIESLSERALLTLALLNKFSIARKRFSDLYKASCT